MKGKDGDYSLAVAQCRHKWQMAVITAFYANWLGQQSWTMARGPTSYLQQPVIATPVIQHKKTSYAEVLHIVSMATAYMQFCMTSTEP